MLMRAWRVLPGNFEWAKNNICIIFSLSTTIHQLYVIQIICSRNSNQWWNWDQVLHGAIKSKKTVYRFFFSFRWSIYSLCIPRKLNPSSLVVLLSLYTMNDAINPFFLAISKTYSSQFSDSTEVENTPMANMDQSIKRTNEWVSVLPASFFSKKQDEEQNFFHFNGTMYRNSDYVALL